MNPVYRPVTKVQLKPFWLGVAKYLKIYRMVGLSFRARFNEFRFRHAVSPYPINERVVVHWTVSQSAGLKPLATNARTAPFSYIFKIDTSRMMLVTSRFH